jgi:hypothetical protein
MARPTVPTRVLDISRWASAAQDSILEACSLRRTDMKHKKTIAGLAVAGSLLAMSGAANAISPAAALGLAALGGAAVGSAAAQANPPAVAVVPSPPTTVVMGAGPAPVAEVRGHYEVINGVYTWVPGSSTVVTTGTVNYDHDADGVLNHVDRYPNDPSRS